MKSNEDMKNPDVLSGSLSIHSIDSFQTLKQSTISLTPQSQKEIKSENIADRIIHAFTIPKVPLFLEDNEDVISYESSEQRLINFGLILATLQCVMFIALLVLIVNFNLKISLELKDSVDEDKLPVSYIMFLSKCKNGHIVTFKQMKNFEVQFAWKFKVPKPKSEHPSQYSQSFDDEDICTRGYSVFEDQGEIFVINNDMAKNIVAIRNKDKHKVLKNSVIPHPHFKRHTTVRVGNHVWVLGGYFRDLKEYPVSHHIGVIALENPKCSSYYQSNEKWTSIWNIRKQTWITGPSFPIHGCILSACGVSFNQTNVLIMFGQPLLVEFEWGEFGSPPSCIHSIQFSFENLTWHSRNDCIIDVGQRNFIPFNEEDDGDFYPNIVNLQCQSIFGKGGNMDLIVSINEDNQQHKMFLLNYPALTSKELVLPLRDHMMLTNTFIIRNVVYFMVLSSTKRAELFVMDNCYNFVKVQEIKEFPMNDNFSVKAHLDEGMLSLPLYQ